MKKSSRKWLAVILILVGMLVMLGVFGGFPMCLGYTLFGTCVGYPLNLNWVFGFILVIVGFAFYVRRR